MEGVYPIIVHEPLPKGYCINVSCSGNFVSLESHDDNKTLTCSRNQESVPVQISVSIEHQSLSDRTAPAVCGYLTVQNFSIRSEDLQCPEIIRSLLYLMHIPFSLEDEKILWKSDTNSCSNNNCKPTNRRPLESSNDLIMELVKFFGSGKGLTKVSLAITKTVALLSDEFKAWESFKREKESEYLEITYEQPMSDMRTCIAIDLELDNLKNKMSTDQSGRSILNDSCQICLEELISKELLSSTMKEEEDDDDDEDQEVIRLPCSHMFHDICIWRWFQVNQTCPCCRAIALSIPNKFLDVYNHLTIRFE